MARWKTSPVKMLLIFKKSNPHNPYSEHKSQSIPVSFLQNDQMKLLKDADLLADADVFVCVLVNKDVDPCLEHGFLQSWCAHPLPHEVREASTVRQLQHTLTILFIKFITNKS